MPDVRCVGVAGPRMLEEGCESLFSMERLSVMGLMEVLAQLPELLALRRTLVRYFTEHPPDVLIGIDAPDFNLGLERRLRDAGIKTMHLVSPTVWAWRPGRVKSIRRAVDLMLSVFPFEVDVLEAAHVPARYVGHPLADQIPIDIDQKAARRALGVPEGGDLVALLPGSRASEVQRLAAPFIEAALLCHRRRPTLRFLVPFVNERLRVSFNETLLRLAPDLPISLIDGRSREVIAAADVMLTASGTATLEGLLSKRPMVVAYRVHPISYHVVKLLRLVKVPHVAMSNILAGRALAPELIQSRCQPALLADEVLALLDDPERMAEIQAEYRRIHLGLRHDAAGSAAEAVLELVGRRHG